MLRYDQRFFMFDRAVYKKGAKTLRLDFICFGSYTPQIPELEKQVTRQVVDFLEEKINIEFAYNVVSRDRSQAEDKAERARQGLEEFMASRPVQTRVDKTLHVSKTEYLFGAGVKSRPVKIKFLRFSRDLQVTAGTVRFLKKREYKRIDKDTGAEVTKGYWTFVLDDGENQLQCVFFPNKKNTASFEKVADFETYCMVGTYDKNNRGDPSFRVAGVSYCAFEK
ncbi:MAG: hypothetical protein FWC00_04540 [Firmicutes bacterium]|nr:hypothetical protein [Bacillota bacterium]